MFVDVFRVQCHDFFVFSPWLNSLASLALLNLFSTMVDIAEELAEENEYMRVSPDPAITVADLEKALEVFFAKVGYRNLQEVVDMIKEAKCGWRTAPKAVA